MPSNNQLLNGAAVRAQIGSGLLWATSDPGTGTLPSNRIMTWGQFFSYIKNDGSNAYSSVYCPTWANMVAHRVLKYSNYSASFHGLGAIAQTGTFSQPNTFTTECWVKIPSSSGAYLSHFDTGNYTGWTLFTRTSGSGFNFGFGYVDGGSVGHQVYENTVRSYGTWYHTALTGSGIGQSLLFYVNGTQVVSASSVYGSAAFGSFELAGDPNYGGMACSIDEVRYWNVVRTQAQIQGSMSVSADSTMLALSSLINCWQLENSWAASKGSYNLSSNSGSNTFTSDTPI